jgi:hypothetical protein
MSDGRVAATIRDLTLDECAAAIGIQSLPPRLRRLLTFPLEPVARRLGSELERFDRDVVDSDLQGAARRTLHRFGAELTTPALAVPRTGPLLVVANHPGAYDALSLFASLPRSDLWILVAERAFLRALPALGPRLVFVPDLERHAPIELRGRSLGFRRALAHLRKGGALLQFGAGRIEPDPAFHPGPSSVLDWQLGSGALALATQRAGGQVLVSVVSGVHSARAKRALVVRAAEARGVTTLAVLLQLAHPYYAEARITVRASPVPAPLPRDRVAATKQLQTTARGLLSV